jgi:hypothetical protein
VIPNGVHAVISLLPSFSFLRRREWILHLLCPEESPGSFFFSNEDDDEEEEDEKEYFFGCSGREEGGEKTSPAPEVRGVREARDVAVVGGVKISWCIKERGNSREILLSGTQKL